MEKYLKRIIDDILEDKMTSIGAILIEGCKWCGKSTTAKQHVKSIIEFQDVDKKDYFDSINNTKPSLFLDNEKPLLIDEWQMYPVVWDAIRNDIDKSGLQGEYILTGSNKPKKNSVMHTGTGRIARILMRPMSLYESKESDGKISLKDLFEGNIDINVKSDITLDKITNLIIRGGWPLSLYIKNQNEVAKNYFQSLINEEVKIGDSYVYNPNRLTYILKSLARNISSITNVSTIEEDVKSNNESISRNTLDSYIDSLKNLYIIENVPAWTGKMRSKIAIRSKEKIQFVDPSIACASLGASENKLKKDLNTLGLLFESLCIRDLRIYADAIDGKVYYYHDETDLEIDAIIELQNGDWGAVEIKLGSGYIKEAEENLLKFKEKVDIDTMGEPKFLMVLTGTNYSYKTEKGVYVVSVGNLKD